MGRWFWIILVYTFLLSHETSTWCKTAVTFHKLGIIRFSLCGLQMWDISIKMYPSRKTIFFLFWTFNLKKVILKTISTPKKHEFSDKIGLVIPSSQFVTSRCLFAVYSTHISGKCIWSQFDRKFDLLYLFNHETIDELLAASTQQFILSSLSKQDKMRGSCV